MQVQLSRRTFPPAPTRAHAVVLTAHPLGDSFNTALAEAWIRGAEASGATVDRIDLAALDFDLQLRSAFQADQPLEPDLRRAQAAIAEAAHLTIAYPVWWGSMPAVLKGFIDRVFLPGWAFKANGGALPDPGLARRSARLLVTMDAPPWYDRLMYGGSARRQMARATLRFCGVRPVRTATFGSVGNTDAPKREKMLAQAARAGRQDGARLVARFAATPALEVT